MKKQILGVTMIFLTLLGIVAFFFVWLMNSRHIEESRREELVLLNEIANQLTDDNGGRAAAEQIKALDESIRYGISQEKVSGYRLGLVVLFGLMMIYTMVLLGYIYWKLLRPFEKMRAYAEQIAGGNLDFALEYERTNFFGPFTWAFDHMREEIIYAKKKEAKAIEENKAIIAALSHDIKTPIASIRAYSEAIEENLNADYEKRKRYTSVIMRKCDEVAALVNDLMLHSLSELEKLEIHCENFEAAAVLENIVHDLEYPDMQVMHPIPQAVVYGDVKRLAQVIENLLNNARKYAPKTKTVIYAERNEETGQYQIHVRDYGTGILPSDMPFITNRFYRGKNVGEQPGSGLGLYIVKYIMEEMQGGVVLTNREDGLDACIWFPLKAGIIS